MVLQPLPGPYGKLPILIRDDDANFFTKTNMLECIYSKAWEKGYKVSLAVVPFQRGINDICVPPEMRNNDANFSIADNKLLVHYLKDKIHNGSLEVLQHGLSHESNRVGRGEFGDDFDKKREILLGRDILKKSFEVNPKFFVPPGEDISQGNIRTLIKCGFVPIVRKTFFDHILRNSLVPSYVKDFSMKALSKYKSKTFNGNWASQLVKPVILSTEEHMISWSIASMKLANTSSTDSLLNQVEKVIESCSISRSPVCLLNHYHVYYYDWSDAITRQDLFHAWEQMLERFHRLNYLWKVTFSELYERTKKIHDLQILRTGSKISLESKALIRNFSFRTTHRLDPSPFLVFDDINNIHTIEELLPAQRIILYEKS